MSDIKTIAVWGSPDSGKTTMSLQIARKLADKKKNVLIVFCDKVCPTIPTILPKKGDVSLGKLLTMPELNKNKVLSECIAIPNEKHIVILGYAHGENALTYSKIAPTRATEFFIYLRHLEVDYIIIDCVSDISHDLLSAVALEKVDKVLRIGTAEPKSLVFFDSILPLIGEARFNAERHLKIISKVKLGQAVDATIQKFKGVEFEFPHMEEAKQKMLECRLLEAFTGSKSKQYNHTLQNLVATLTGDEKAANKKRKRGLKNGK